MGPVPIFGYKGTTKNAHTQVKRTLFTKKIDFIYLIAIELAFSTKMRHWGAFCVSYGVLLVVILSK
jgi:hypothetical protein